MIGAKRSLSLKMSRLHSSCYIYLFTLQLLIEKKKHEYSLVVGYTWGHAVVFGSVEFLIGSKLCV